MSVIVPRYGRRIEYYQDKAEEGRTDTQPRIQELQDEVIKLQQEVRLLEGEKKQEDVWETEKNEKSSSAKGERKIVIIIFCKECFLTHGWFMNIFGQSFAVEIEHVTNFWLRGRFMRTE